MQFPSWLLLSGISLLIPQAWAQTPDAARECRVGADVRFAKNSAVLSDSDIEKIIAPIKLVTAKGDHVVAYIAVGHTDATEGNAQAAHLLSLARAGAVAAQVLRAFPALKSETHIEGKGSAQPVASYPPYNRRVEVEVICAPKSMQ